MLRAEFTVEPFVAGRPGPHVTAALEAARASGLPVEEGPFGSFLEGDDAAVLAAVGAVLEQALAAGATRVSLQVSRGGLGPADG
jgi:uncharacterized protein YqgV (UPF0045/DUF77 family)